MSDPAEGAAPPVTGAAGGWRARDRMAGVTSSIPAAVRESLSILATHRALFGPPNAEGATVDDTRITRVIDAFEEAGASWVLVGAQAVGILTEPRATADFEFIVESARLPRLLEVLRREMGELSEDDVGAAIRLKALDVDLIRSGNHALFREALALRQPAGSWFVPSPEALLVLKFLSAVNPWRSQAKRIHDVGDLAAVYRAVGADALDRGTLDRLAGLVYPGAEAELRSLLDRIDRGDPLSI